MSIKDIKESFAENEGNVIELSIASSRLKLPFGFFSNTQGLFFKKPEDETASWICSPLDVLARTRDENNENWGIRIQFEDPDNHPHTLAIPMEMMSGDCNELFSLLLSHGLRMTTNSFYKKKLPEFLQTIKIDKTATCTTRIGWHQDRFILPDKSIPEADEIYLQSDNNNFVGFRQAGTLEEWQDHIAAPCRGNSRLVFSLSCAFAAPLLPLINQESGGFNLKGASSIGKSTALAVAASVWGSPKYIQSWKATGNALEAVAEAHNNALLCLDELGQVDGKEAGQIAYTLGNGCGKNRLKAKGGLRKKYEWNLLFLSTGEVSIADKMNEMGKKTHAGMLTRMVDIPADAGKGHRLFDIIHAFKDGNELAIFLKEQTSQYFGTPIHSFLPHVIEIKKDLHEKVKQLHEKFFTTYVKSDAEGQAKRVAARFAVVAVGGELAIQCGSLPYDEGEAFKAAGICFEAWVEERGGTDNHEAEDAVKQVRSFIETHHSSRFEMILEERGGLYSEKITNQAGYKKKTKEGDYEYFVFCATFEKEVCKGLNHQFVKKTLADLGLLYRDSEGKYSPSTYIPHMKKKMRMIHLASSIFGESET